MNILITGATDGIGLALAKYYQAQNMHLVLIGRKSLAELDASFFNDDNYCQCDLSKADALMRIVNWLDARSINTLDITIHNAGLGWYGDPTSQTADNIENLLNVNVRAPLALTHALFPRTKDGQVVFISSVSANLPAPLYAVYSATKSALDGFARSLRVETGGKPIVQVIHIGAVRTGMHTKSGIPAGKLNTEKFQTPESAAIKIANAIASKRKETTIGAVNSVLRWVGSHFPALMDALVKRRA